MTASLTAVGWAELVFRAIGHADVERHISPNPADGGMLLRAWQYRSKTGDAVG